MPRKNKKNASSNIFRQGDVLLVPVNSIPPGLKKTHRCTLALGESTGHHHTIDCGAIGYTETDSEVSMADYIAVENALAKLTHQEHDTIEIPKGNYRVYRQVQYTPEAIKPVAD
jgi:hypothetical protein